MQQLKNANRWDEQDPFTLFPIDEFEDLGILKALGLTARELKMLVRIRIIDGQQDSKGEVLCSLHEIENFVYGEEIKLNLRLATLSNWSPEEVAMDRDVTVLEYLLRKILAKPVTLAQLRELVK